MTRAGIDRFFATAKERELIRLRREGGAAPPWTDDPVLRAYRFCNVFREDDAATRWFRRLIRDPLRDSPYVVLATIIFRWFNRPSTGQVLHESQLLIRWDPEVAGRVLSEVSPLVTGAYIIKTPNGLSKLDGLIWCINNVWDDRLSLMEDLSRARTLQAAHRRLMKYPYLGPFMAYEVVSDLRHTALLEDATDINQWASLGPGATRGLSRILAGRPSYWSKIHRQTALMWMSHLLQQSRRHERWPWPERPWEMREVEHWLCEHDKYERARLHEGPLKRRFESPCT